ncbi:hypothetical protein ACPCVO_36100 [Streptomyces umbrinus]|uniref:hypothetical protein n=1 Tax=Streptomyces umbrinus TaxID=67370 RepID=UPI003C2B6ADC
MAPRGQGRAKYRLVFVDLLLAALILLRKGAAHDVLDCWGGVDRSIVAPDVRLWTLAEVVDHLGARRQTGVMDGTEIRVPRRGPSNQDGLQGELHPSLLGARAGTWPVAVRRPAPVSQPWDEGMLKSG